MLQTKFACDGTTCHVELFNLGNYLGLLRAIRNHVSAQNLNQGEKMLQTEFACGHQTIESTGSGELLTSLQDDRLCPECFDGVRYTVARQMGADPACTPGDADLPSCRPGIHPDDELCEMDPEGWVKREIRLDDYNGREVFQLMVFLRRIREYLLDLANYDMDDLTYGEQCGHCNADDWMMLAPDGTYLCCEHIGKMKEHS